MADRGLVSNGVPGKWHTSFMSGPYATLDHLETSVYGFPEFRVEMFKVHLGRDWDALPHINYFWFITGHSWVARVSVKDSAPSYVIEAHRVIVWVNLPDFRAEGACK